jgi:hypothetical protein
MLLALLGYRTDDFDKVYQDLVARKLAVMEVPEAVGGVKDRRLMTLGDNHGNDIYISSETKFEAEDAAGYVVV